MKHLILLTFIFLVSCYSTKVPQKEMTFNDKTKEFGQLDFYQKTIEDIKAIYGKPTSIKVKYQESGFMTAKNLDGGSISFTAYQTNTILYYKKLGLVFHFDGEKNYRNNKESILKLSRVRLTKDCPYLWNNIKIGRTTFNELDLENDAFFGVDAFMKKVEDTEKYFRLWSASHDEDIYYGSDLLLKADYPNYHKLSDSTLQVLKKLPIEIIEF